ncbi:hypothetical protein PoB_004404600 [Plakobranchus ocellatus]|uniref:Uncharacterized protein n=1 Tax=Plakobranchus ocellatus TaxID=259542 RepID=A0AAV4BAV3_9GAST|nr:hypothetical protein PoB_004404600 [Plakobranchus ocellatus]
MARGEEEEEEGGKSKEETRRNLRRGDLTQLQTQKRTGDGEENTNRTRGGATRLTFFSRGPSEAANDNKHVT